MALMADHFRPMPETRKFGLPTDETSSISYEPYANQSHQILSMTQSNHNIIDPGMFNDMGPNAFEAQRWGDANTMRNTMLGSPATINPEHGAQTRRRRSSKALSHTQEDEEQRAAVSKRTRRDSTTSKDGAKTRKQRQRLAAVAAEEEEDKRQLHLKRNRKAAERCREKRRRHEEELQGLVQTLEMNNVQLRNDATALQNEMIGLKTECLRHFECNCSGIRNYLVDSARPAVNGGDQSGQGSSGNDQMNLPLYSGSDIYTDGMGGYLYSH